MLPNGDDPSGASKSHLKLREGRSVKMDSEVHLGKALKKKKMNYP